jgi:hypothetical protein
MIPRWRLRCLRGNRWLTLPWPAFLGGNPPTLPIMA